jgi:hypothetical protein
VIRHKKAQKWLSLLLLAFFVVTCHKPAQNPSITFKYNVTPQPPRVGVQTIEVDLNDRNGQPVSGARVDLEGNMSHPGMSPVSGVATEIQSGKYRGTLQLTMVGDWIVLVNVTLSDGQRLQNRFELNGVRSNWR